MSSTRKHTGQDRCVSIQAFRSRLEDQIWRPRSSGRIIVLDWLHALVSEASRGKSGSTAQRTAVVDALAGEEDFGHPRHPFQRLPGNHRSPTTGLARPAAFRTWPDRLQACVAFDSLCPPQLGLPRAVTDGHYWPVGLHTPRLSVVRIEPRDAEGNYVLHFAEAPPLASPTLVPAHFYACRPGADKSRLEAPLSQLADCFADPMPFLRLEALPHWQRCHSWRGCPTFGLVDAALLGRLHSSTTLAPEVDGLAQGIRLEQQQLVAYAEGLSVSVNGPLSPKRPS